MSEATDRADRATADAHLRYAAADADARLSEQGRRERKLTAWSNLKRELDSIRVNEEAARETRRQNVQRQLFGLPSSATSFDLVAHRDAKDRAARFEDAQTAADAMSRARDDGDESMVRAIASHAVNAGWDDLIDAYVRQINPAAGPLIQELQQNGPTPGQQIEEFGHYIAFPPPGMTGMTDWQLEGELARLQSAASA